MAGVTTTLLNRFKIWQKLAIVGLAFTIPLAITTYFLLDEKSIKIDFARYELFGDEYLRPCAELLEHLAAHATLERERLEGDATVRSRLAELSARIDRDFLDLAAVDRELGGPLETGLDRLRTRQRDAAFPATLRSQWERLKAGSPDVKTSNDRHAEVIAGVRLLITHVGDTSKLILDPDLDTYYQMDALLLRQPEIIDRLHGLRETVAATTGAKGVGKAMAPAERDRVAAALALIAYHNDTVEMDARMTINEAPNFSRYAGIERAIGGPMTESVSATRAALDLVQRTVIDAETAGPATIEVIPAIDRALTLHVRYWTVLLDHMDVMLKIRMNGDIRRRTFALTSTLIAVLLTALLTVLILRSITTPIQKAVHVANQLSRGELPESIEVGSATDETGVLLRAINDMLSFLDLRRTITTLKETTEVLSLAVGELEAQVVEQDQAASRQAAALQETQVTSQEIRQTSRLAAEKASAVLKVAERADLISRSGEAAIEKSVGGLTDIRKQVGDISQKIDELDQRTAQIGVITQTVKDLADQSNMLALNAAIEAVRSGEHGKGFAVVAREIRSLADQSIQATNRVNEILESVSSSIRSAVGIADTGRQRMEASVLEVRSSGERLGELSAIVQESSQSARQIAAAVSQQDAGVNEIFRAIGDQSTLMNDMVERVESTRRAISKVKSAAERVSDLADRFRV